MSKLVQIKLKFFPDDSFRKYKKINPQIYQRLIQTAKKIRNQKIIHINSAPYGGGVAEILKSQVLLENSFGLKSYWFTIKAPRHFFVITKKIHNLLQGKGGLLSKKEREFYLSINRELKDSLQKFLTQLKSGIVVIHDPQPIPLIGFIPKTFSSILRFHLDLSTPNPATLDFLRPFIDQYHLVIVSNKDYCLALPWVKKSKIKVIFPAIDPLSEKNRLMDPAISRIILEQFGINCSKPIITQVSRFDSWKDPLGVIRAYYLAKNKIPELQLVLAGFFQAQDDPEAISVFEQVKKHARGDPDIHLFSNLKNLKDISHDVFINALYTASLLTIQDSLREGFGLTITEAMWKGKVVVARITSGALLQIKNEKNGILFSSSEETAKAIIRLIKNEKLRQRLGKAAHQSVKRKFLMLRLILDNIKSYNQLINK